MNNLYSLNDLRLEISKGSPKESANLQLAENLVKSTETELMQKLKISTLDECKSERDRIITHFNKANREISDKKVTNSILLTILEIFLSCFGICKLRDCLEPISIRKIDQVFKKITKNIEEQIARSKKCKTNLRLFFKVTLHTIIANKSRKLAKRARERINIRNNKINRFVKFYKEQKKKLLVQRFISNIRNRLAFRKNTKLQSHLDVFKRKYRERFIAKFPEDQRATVQKILQTRSKYEMQPKKEIERLTKAGIITERFKEIDPKLTILLARLIELKQLLNDTHYVFSHAQCMTHTPFSELITELTSLIQPDAHNPISLMLRKFQKLSYLNSKDFLDKNPTINDHLQMYCLLLLSIDAYSWNTNKAESSLYYSKNNTSSRLNFNPEVYKNVYDSIFQSFFPNLTELGKKIRNHLSIKAAAIGQRKHKACTDTGALIPLIVPKSLIDNPIFNFSYQCKPYGVPVQSPSMTVQQFQDDKTKLLDSDQIQFRLLTDRLAQETAAGRVFALQNTMLHRTDYHSTRRDTRLLALEAELYFKLLNLTTDSPKQEIVKLITKMKRLRKVVNKDIIQEIIKHQKRNGLEIKL